jgi:subtilisin family serine protease
LDQAEDGQVKAWVLFDLTDKGLASAEALEATLDDLASTYHPRAIQRRRLRRTLPGLFDIHDIPVSQSYIDQVRATGAEIRVVSRWVNGISVRADREQLARLDALPFVKVIQPVRHGPKIEPTGVEPIPGGASQGGAAAPAGGSFYGASEEQLTQINLISLHGQGFTGNNVIVGILDTGFNRSHVAFNDISHPVDIVTEWDFINDDGDTSYEDGDPENQHRHGTLILGVLGAYKPTELVGGAYDASFILCKTEDTTDEYPGEEDFYVAGLEFIEANGGDMATASLTYSDWYTQADMDGMTAVTTIGVNIATANGVHCCNAAGNAGHDDDPETSHLGAPADALRVFTCGAVDFEGVIASFSSDGPTADGRVKPEVLARGVYTSTVSASNDTEYTTASGTSLSTPLVACAVACLVQAHPDWTAEQMRSYVMHTAGDYVANQTYDPLYVRGYGIVDAATAAEGDCNDNDIDDATDIATGTSQDCNENGIPDECDIAYGTSRDMNGDGIPDECAFAIPTVSEWGIVVMALLVLATATLVFRRCRLAGG